MWSTPRGSGPACSPSTRRRTGWPTTCVSNPTLWFVHHGLYDLPARPAFDRELREAWQAYREVNDAFAGGRGRGRPEGAAVLVQDYHLGLLGLGLAERRPDLAAVHFSHTPFATPTWLRVLPTTSPGRSCPAWPPTRPAGSTPRAGRTTSSTAPARCWRWPPAPSSPLPTDADDVLASAASPACDARRWRRSRPRSATGVWWPRVDRIELSKNLLRGFLAFDDLLRPVPGVAGAGRVRGLGVPVAHRRPRLRRVPGRGRAAGGPRQRALGHPGWTPIVYDTSDDYPRSLAVLRGPTCCW